MLVLLAGMSAFEYADPDLWGRISVGAILDQSGRLPTVDDFSYTARGATWVDHEWLAGVVFYQVLALVGEPGLVLLKYALAALTLWLVFAIQRLHGVSPVYAGWGLVLASPVYLLGYITTLRAQAFSFPAFLCVVWMLERVRLGRSRPLALAWLVPLTVAWGNAHGGFVMGTLVAALYALTEAWLRGPRAGAAYAALAAGMFAGVILVNPYGVDYGAFLLHAWSLDRSAITEWQPLVTFPPSAGQLYAALFATVAAGLALRDAWRALGQRLPIGARRLAPVALAPSAVLALLVAMSLQANRIRTFLGLALVALLPIYLKNAPAGGLAARLHARIENAGRLVRGVLPAALGIAAIAIVVLVQSTRPPLRAVVPQTRAAGSAAAGAYPVGAVRFLRHSPYSGNLLNPFLPGEFLLWSLYPRFRVSMDGRYEEVYTQEQFRAVREFFVTGLTPVASQLGYANGSGADFVLVPSNWPVRRLLGRSPGWREVYDDGSYALIARESSIAGAPEYAPRGAPRPLLTVGNYFTPSDRARFRGYPR